jgi:hypothetical protein
MALLAGKQAGKGGIPCFRYAVNVLATAHPSHGVVDPLTVLGGTEDS